MTLPSDLEPLLAPISPESPCGSSLRFEGTYDRIREARREDDPSLPMGDWETNLKVADLALIEKLCREALQKKTKDLQIGAWLTEAWLRRYRFRGLATGLSFVAQLVERFWDGFFPDLGEDGDPGPRAALIEWMDDVLTVRTRTTSFAEGNDASFTLLDWESAGQTPPRDPGADDAEVAPRPTRESLLARISLGGNARWSNLAKEAADAIAGAEAVEQAFAAKMEQPPTLRRLREVLAVVVQLARDGARVSGEMSPVAEVNVGSTGDMHIPDGIAAFSSASTGRVSQGIASRADAYYRLAEAAEYLMRTEPHSPVPYLVKRAVQWGNMSLGELLYEFVGNPDDLVAIQRLLGMRGREE